MPTTPDGPSLADWAESAVIIEDRRHMSRSNLRRRLIDGTLDEEQDADAQVEILLSEVSRRARIAPAAYPFRETRIGLSRNEGVDHAPYEFLLWLSVSPHFREQRRFPEVDELFDDLVAQALSAYLGKGARAVRFGWPPSGDRPGGFPDAIRWLADLLDLKQGPGTPRSESNDGGADVVAWRPFGDKRTGFIVVLCQCTVRKDWPSKISDVRLRTWQGWIDFGPSPLAALAVPFAVPLAFKGWDDLRREAMILDRLRLSELMVPNSLPSLEAMRSWTSGERALLGAGG